MFFAGCSSSPSSRIKANQDLFNSYPADVQQHIRKGEVAIGFTVDQTRMAFGEPTQKNTVTTQSGAREVWLYRKSSPSVSIGFGLGLGAIRAPFGIGTGLGVSVPVGKRGDSMRVIFENDAVVQIEKAQ